MTAASTHPPFDPELSAALAELPDLGEQCWESKEGDAIPFERGFAGVVRRSPLAT